MGKFALHLMGHLTFIPNKAVQLLYFLTGAINRDISLSDTD
jgi:hypothetical protein